jgi:hypothetical protein
MTLSDNTRITQENNYEYQDNDDFYGCENGSRYTRDALNAPDEHSTNKKQDDGGDECFYHYFML